MLTKSNTKTCARLLNDLSEAFYYGDERIKKHVDLQLAFYDLIFISTETMLILTNILKED